jgi:purine-nucleoside phosphorylase
LQFGSEAIEMETTLFYRCMEIMDREGIAILCVSDNSTTQNALVGRNDDDTRKFHKGRETLIVKLVLNL